MVVNNNRGNTTKLDNETKQMYNNAIGYYRMKKIAFLKQLTNNKNQIDDKQFIEELEKKVQKGMEILSTSWNIIDKYIMNNIDETTKRSTTGEAAVAYQEQIENLSNMIGSFNSEQIQNKFDCNKQQAELISEIFTDDNIKNSLLSASISEKEKRNLNVSYDKISGYFYERYIAAAIQFIGESIGIQANEIADSLLSQFIHTGAYTTSRATAVKSKKGLDISSDVGTSNMGKAIFRVEVSKTEQQKMMNLSTAEDWFSLLNDQGHRGSMFGFSAKRWEIMPGRMQKYTQSVTLQNLINSSYKNDSRGKATEKGRKSWNVNYAYAYMQLELSRHAIALLGPNNIGVFVGSNFVWMDNFVKNITLLMNVYTKNTAYYGRTDEVLPYIASSNVYIRSKPEEIKSGKTNKFEKHGKGRGTYYRINLLTDITWGQ